MQRFDVRAAGPDAPFGEPLGRQPAEGRAGARADAAIRCVFLLAAQPTRGLDVGAVEAVYGHIRAARERGVGVLLISSELDELLSVADRIVVLYRGRIMGECAADARERATHRRLMAGQDRMTALTQAPRVTLGRAARARRPRDAACSVARRVVALRCCVGLAADRADRRAGAGGARRLRRRRLGLALRDRRLDQPRRWRSRSSASASSSPSRANLTNVGGEGQIAVGGIAATARAPLWRRGARCRCGLAFIVPMLAGGARRRALGRASPAC